MKRIVLFLIIISWSFSQSFGYVFNVNNKHNNNNININYNDNLFENIIFDNLNDIDTNPLNNTGKLPEPGTLLLFGTGMFGLLSTFVRRFFRQIKRLMDIIISIIVIIITLPLTIFIAIAIKITSKGPVFFKQERIGQNKRRISRRKSLDNKLISESERRRNENRQLRSYGKRFIMYKFRTMCVDAEKQTGPVWAKEKDNRITKLGYLLRKSHLDELPQFINVLKGDMSIIGPRPERHVFIEKLNKEIKIYNRRLLSKPGITGLAQVRQHYDTSLDDVKRKVHYDVLYIKKMCLLMDLRIMVDTFFVMMTGKGAR